MSEPTPSEIQTQTPFPPSKWPFRILILVALVALACLSWLFPSYRKVISQNETLTKTNQDLQQKLEIASKTKTNSRTFYPNGRIASETTSETDTNTSQVVDSRTSNSSDARSFKETVTKRGFVSVGLFWGDSYIPKAVNADASILGPLQVQGEMILNPFQAMAGIKLSL